MLITHNHNEIIGSITCPNKTYILNNCKQFDELDIDIDRYEANIYHKGISIGSIDKTIIDILCGAKANNIEYSAFVGHISGKWNPERFDCPYILVKNLKANYKVLYEVIKYAKSDDYLGSTKFYRDPNNDIQLSKIMPSQYPMTYDDYLEAPSILVELSGDSIIKSLNHEYKAISIISYTKKPNQKCYVIPVKNVSKYTEFAERLSESDISKYVKEIYLSLPDKLTIYKYIGDYNRVDYRYSYTISKDRTVNFEFTSDVGTNHIPNYPSMEELIRREEECLRNEPNDITAVGLLLGFFFS